MQRLKRITLVLTSLAIALLVADSILKALRLPKNNARVMLLSGSGLSTDKHGVRRYEPNKVVEQAGYIDSKLAYRYKYRTNNLGFVSAYDYQPGETLGLLITGDSMTEGQEVGPWLDELQRHLFNRYGVSSQNAGIAGNGFVEFERAATFAKSHLNAKKVMVIFIPDDMYRFGDIMVANQNCSTYEAYTHAEIDCNSGRPTWHHYHPSLSDAELASLAESRMHLGLLPTLRRPVLATARRAIRWLCKTGMRVHSKAALAIRINGECDAYTLASSVQGADAPSITAPSAQGADAPPIPLVTVESIRKILQTYGANNVLMVMIPGGSYSFKRIQPQIYLTKTFEGELDFSLKFVDISESCEMPPALWGVGGHPSSEGYRKLQSCFLSNGEIIKFASGSD